MKWLERMPMTNTRIAITILIVIGTAVRYWYTGVAPDGEWLAFLAVMSGLDVTAALGKRATNKPEVIRAEAEAAVKRIEATAAAVPPLTPKEAVEAGATSDTDGVETVAPTPVTIRPYDPPEGGLPGGMVKDD